MGSVDTPIEIVLALIAVNIAAFAAFYLDKRASIQGQSRIPESTLLMLSLAGGSPAAYAAMRIFRHKTIKSSFQIKFWLIVIVQAFLLGHQSL